jgi:YD repeat-containing protein
MVPSLGYAALKSEYRGKILTKTTWLDEKKNPVDTSLGYAVLIQTVNKNNKLTGIRFEHADGSAAVCPEGWASCKRELDKNGREFSVKYYDLSGKMIRLNSGYAYEEKTWDGDRTCTIARFDESGNPVPAGNGYTLLKQEFSKGLLIRETCLDANGKTVEDLTGTAIRTYTWDEDGRLSQVRYADAQSVPALNSEGCAGYSEKVEGDGFRIARTYLGTDGKPVNTAGGYSEIRYLYDENRLLRGTEYYDVNGVLVKAE